MKTVQGVLRGWHTVDSQELAFEVESVYLLPKGTPLFHGSLKTIFKPNIKLTITNIVHAIANFYFGK